jgi:hypothetical protein
VVEISVITKLALARVLLHPFLPTALAGGQPLCGARQSSGIASRIRLLGRDEIPRDGATTLGDLTGRLDVLGTVYVCQRTKAQLVLL